MPFGKGEQPAAAALPAQEPVAPLPGGFKSMKNRWLAEFEAEQAVKQAAEAATAAAEAVAEEAAAASIAQSLTKPAQLLQPPGSTTAAQQRSSSSPGLVKSEPGAAAPSAPDTSSAHSEADQHPGPSHELLGANAADALPPHLTRSMEVDAAAASPLSDADSTKQHSPPQPPAAQRQPAGAPAAPGDSGHRKRKAEPSQQQPSAQRQRTPTPPSRLSDGMHEAAATDGPQKLPQLRESHVVPSEKPPGQLKAKRPALKQEGREQARGAEAQPRRHGSGEAAQKQPKFDVQPRQRNGKQSKPRPPGRPDAVPTAQRPAKAGADAAAVGKHKAELGAADQRTKQPADSAAERPAKPKAAADSSRKPEPDSRRPGAAKLAPGAKADRREGGGAQAAKHQAGGASAVQAKPRKPSDGNASAAARPAKARQGGTDAGSRQEGSRQPPGAALAAKPKPADRHTANCSVPGIVSLAHIRSDGGKTEVLGEMCLLRRALSPVV